MKADNEPQATPEENRVPWYHMGSIDPHRFGLLPRAEAAATLWDLLAWQGDAAGVIRELEALRQRKVAEVCDAMLSDLASAEASASASTSSAAPGGETD